jgi:5,10-methylenetetrahydromethanopterin reductase
MKNLAVFPLALSQQIPRPAGNDSAFARLDDGAQELMTVPFNLGVLQLSMEPVRETIAMAKACEQAGFDTFWMAEAYPWWRKHSFEARSSTAILAVIASETQRIQLGWGIISPYTRHPVQIAMEARVMQELAGNRFLLGLGASKIFMKEIGEGESEMIGPAVVMRESIEIVRGVLAGNAFEYRGRKFTAEVPALKSDAHRPRGIPPIYVAATGPVLQKLAGSLGDGLLTASITTPAFVRYSRKNMQEGARKAGKDPAKLVLGSVIVGSIARDSAEGKEGAREQAAMYLANKVQNIKASADVLLQCAGLTFSELQPVADAMERGGRKAAARAVTDEILFKVCPIAGTPEECLQRIEEYRAAGCTHIMLEIWGDDRAGQAKLFGERVLPHIKR